jgi:hypothetical protein
VRAEMRVMQIFGAEEKEEKRPAVLAAGREQVGIREEKEMGRRAGGVLQ